MATKLTDLAIRKAQPREKKYKLSGGNGLTLCVMQHFRHRDFVCRQGKRIVAGAALSGIVAERC